MTLRALVGITPEWWTPESEKKPNDAGEVDAKPAAFHLYPLTGPQMLEVQEHFDMVNTTVKGPGLLLACRFGLKGWRNVVNENDEELPFNRLSVDKLPAEILAVVGAKIIANSVLDGDAEKN